MATLELEELRVEFEHAEKEAALYERAVERAIAARERYYRYHEECRVAYTKALRKAKVKG